MRVVAVAGSGDASDTEVAWAYEVGRLLGAAGCAVACGGLGGVMEAVCRGAKEAGGFTVGLLPGDDARDGNDALDVAIPTGLGEARNILVARAGEALIAIGTGPGTLSEIALALKAGIRVVALGSWDLQAARGRAVPGYTVARTPADAVRAALGV